jgi:exonuclease V
LNVLEKLNKGSIRASDIAAQYWCERQMELNYIHGAKITAEIRKGKEMHGNLEAETNVPIVLMPRSYADAMYKGLYTSYSGLSTIGKNKKTREVQVYGSLNGFKFVGKVDQMEVMDGGVVIVEDKTRSSDRMPSESQLTTHKVQVMLYKKAMDDIQMGRYTAGTFEQSYHASKLRITWEFDRQLEALGVESQIRSVSAIAERLFSSIKSVGRISDTLYIRYINQATGNIIETHKIRYDENEMSSILDFSLKYWKGERESLPVPEKEKWKCNFCAFFGKECKVWWPQKVL